MSKIGLSGATRPVILEENGCCHYPSPWGMKECFRQTEDALRSRNRFWVLVSVFSGYGWVFQVEECDVLVWVHEFGCWYGLCVCRFGCGWWMDVCSLVFSLGLNPWFGKWFFFPILPLLPETLGSKTFPWSKTAARQSFSLTSVKETCFYPRNSCVTLLGLLAIRQINLVMANGVYREG